MNKNIFLVIILHLILSCKYSNNISIPEQTQIRASLHLVELEPGVTSLLWVILKLDPGCFSFSKNPTTTTNQSCPELTAPAIVNAVIAIQQSISTTEKEELKAKIAALEPIIEIKELQQEPTEIFLSLISKLEKLGPSPLSIGGSNIHFECKPKSQGSGMVYYSREYIGEGPPKLRLTQFVDIKDGVYELGQIGLFSEDTDISGAINLTYFESDTEEEGNITYKVLNEAFEGLLTESQDVARREREGKRKEQGTSGKSSLD